jgi:hypothetical protein
MSIFYAAANALYGQVHEQQIGECIDNLCCVLRYNIILQPSALILAICSIFFNLLTSSHQSRVDVTGDHRPSCSGGYAIEGSSEKKVVAISPQSTQKLRMV